MFALLPSTMSGGKDGLYLRWRERLFFVGAFVAAGEASTEVVTESKESIGGGGQLVVADPELTGGVAGSASVE